MIATAPPSARTDLGMSADAYHAVDSASASRLKAMRRSPAHALYQQLNPPESDAMALGSLLHAMALEPETVASRYMPMPDCDRRTKEGKAIWAAAMNDAAFRQPVKREHWAAANDMAAACTTHPAWRTLFAGPGQNELSVFWQDEEHGINCKLRADRIANVPGFGTVCIDLKTTQDASRDGFGRSLHKFGYHLQGAFYLDGLARAGIACDAFVIMAVESSAPYCVAVYAIGDESLEQGRRECRRLLATYAACKRSGKWPGYDSNISRIDVPAWALDDDGM